MKRKLLFILSFLACLCFISCLNSCSCSKRKNDHSHSYEWEVTKEATCTEDGTRTGACSCGNKITESVPASHKILYWIYSKNPTCESDGLKVGTCSICKESFTETVKGGHKFVEIEVEMCKSEGSYNVKLCSSCNLIENVDEEIIHPHTFDEKVERTDPTCTEAGECGWKCSKCGKKAVVKIDALGHQPGITATMYNDEKHSFNCQRQGCEAEAAVLEKHVFDDYVIIKNSTCTEKGEAEAFCTACGYHKTVTIERGHKWSEWELSSNPSKPCESKRFCRLCGLIETDEIHVPDENATYSFPDYVDCCVATFTCTRCGERLDNVTLTHKWETTSHRAATCIKEGYRNQKCSYCNDTRTAFDNPYGHDTAWDYNSQEHWKICDDCGYVIYQNEHHSFEAVTYEYYNEETDAYDYWLLKKCTVCSYQENYFDGTPFVPSPEVPEPGNPGTPVVPSPEVPGPGNPSTPVVPSPEVPGPGNPICSHIHYGAVAYGDNLPTCTEGGYFPGVKCPTCDMILKEAELVKEPLGHSFVNSICSRCGECELEFELSSDGEYYIVKGVGAFEGGALTIPAMYNEKYVLEIADNAFKNNSTITSVKILDSVKKIGNSAFENCSLLTYIRIGEAVKSIGSRAFYGCANVTQIDYMATSIDPDNNETNENNEKVYSDAFAKIGFNYKDTDTNVLFVIGKDVRTIPSDLFNCSSSDKVFIKTVIFEEGTSCTKIGSSAFSNCDTLEDVIYNATFAEWCSISFGNESASPMYHGKHFYTEGHEIIDITTPSTITKINSYAFTGFDYLTNLVITDNIIEIGTNIVSSCRSLTNITFGPSLQVFEPLNNKNLVNVYFTGTLSDWLSIEYEESKDNPMYYAEHLYIDGNLVTEVVVPSNITEIKAFAFYGVEELKKITIHNNVTVFGAYAFGQCTQLNDVYYNGTVAEWMNITFSSTIKTPNYIVSTIGRTDVPHDHFTGQALSNSKSLSAIKGTGLSSLERMVNSYGVTSIDEYYTVMPENEYLGAGMTIIAPYFGYTNVFVGEQANPLSYASNFYIGGEKVTEIVIPEGVTTIPSYAFAGYKGLKSVTIPASVTSIGGSAFEGCECLESVYYNGTIEGWLNIDFLKVEVKEAGNTTSDGFTTIIRPSLGIEETPIGELKYANPLCYAEKFYIGNELVTDIVVPDSITQINHYAFYGYKGLKSITLHSRVCYIGEESFTGCESLESVYFNGSIESWLKIKYTLSDFYNDISFSVSIRYNKMNQSNPLQYADKFYINNELVTDLVIPETVGKIGNYVFYGYNGFNSITLPANITSIGIDAFYGAESLENVYYLGDVTGWCNISFPTSEDNGSNPIRYTDNFYVGDKLLTDLVIPVEINTIKNNSFYGYDELKSVTLHNAVLYIQSDAFFGCEGIENVYYQGSLSDWFDITFVGKYSNPASYAEHLYINGNELTTLVIPDTVTEIKQYAFYDCDFITSITIPDSVTQINSYAFFGCDGLGTVVIPGSVTSINNYAFGYCNNIVIYCESVGKPNNWNECWACSGNGYTTTPCWYSASKPTDTAKKHYYWHYVDGEIVVWDDKEVPKGYEKNDGSFFVTITDAILTPTIKVDGSYTITN